MADATQQPPQQPAEDSSWLGRLKKGVTGMTAGGISGAIYGLFKKGGGFGEALKYAEEGAAAGGIADFALDHNTTLAEGGAEFAGAATVGGVSRLTGTDTGLVGLLLGAGGGAALSKAATGILGEDVGSKLLSTLGIGGAAAGGAIAVSKIAGGSTAAAPGAPGTAATPGTAGTVAAAGAGIADTAGKGLNAIKSALTGPDVPGKPGFWDQVEHAVGFDGPEGFVGGIKKFAGDHPLASLAGGLIGGYGLFSSLKGGSISGIFGSLLSILILPILFMIGGKLLGGAAKEVGLGETFDRGQQKTNAMVQTQPGGGMQVAPQPLPFRGQQYYPQPHFAYPGQGMAYAGPSPFGHGGGRRW